MITSPTSGDDTVLAITDWMGWVVPQEWELEPDPIELPESTSKNAVDTWMQTSARHLPTVFCPPTKISESQKISGNVEVGCESSVGITEKMAGPPTGPCPKTSSPINVYELSPDFGPQISRAPFMFNIAITSMELWQSNQDERYEYVLVHLAWYSQGRHCATSNGNLPAQLSRKIYLERNLRTWDYFTATVEGEALDDTCLLRLRFVGNFLPSVIDLISASWVLCKKHHAHNLLEYSTFWYADTVMALMATLEGVESETQVAEGKEWAYKNLERGLRRDIRKNGFTSDPRDGKATNVPGWLWTGWPGWTMLGLNFGLGHRSRYTKGFPFPIDKRTDATALEGTKRDTEHAAARICSELKGIIDKCVQPGREERRELDQSTRTMHEEIVQHDISLALESGRLGAA
ncbi:hypothetical protein BDN72DRAFT_905998 [Pluteus cervinus]|uniref:Uncharacterized protein n=1 Tax=Pluteus cervinus TaxID=181527 RepID=A0ACD3A1J2_9AGAR|nr:hypothetical protein BDN72DRAFT_905998 [Pluteus cervinus]